MKVRNTLTLNPKVIQKAKTFLKKKDGSLSGLVNYLLSEWVISKEFNEKEINELTQRKIKEMEKRKDKPLTEEENKYLIKMLQKDSITNYND